MSIRYVTDENGKRIEVWSQEGWEAFLTGMDEEALNESAVEVGLAGKL